jgi:hypothetical protein
MYRGGVPFAGLNDRSELSYLLALLPDDLAWRIDILDDAVGKVTRGLESRLRRFQHELLSASNTAIPWDALRAPDWPTTLVSLSIASRLISCGLWTPASARKKLDLTNLESEISRRQLVPPYDDNIDALVSWLRRLNVAGGEGFSFPCKLCNLRSSLCHTIRKLPSGVGVSFSIDQWTVFGKWEDSIKDLLAKLSKDTIFDLRQRALEVVITEIKLASLLPKETDAIRSLLSRSQAAYCKLCADERAASESLCELLACCSRLGDCRRTCDSGGYVREANIAKSHLAHLEALDENCRVPI